MRWRVGVVALVALACTQPHRPREAAPRRFMVSHDPAVPKTVRVPTTFVPRSYRMRLAVGDEIVGSVEIDADLPAPTDVLWLHGIVEVASAFAIAADGTRTPLEARGMHNFLALLAEKPLAAGRYTIAIAYRARIDDLGDVTADAESYYPKRPHLEGVFREHAGGAAYTYTMFEPMGARAAFPCLDEPGVKVPWQLTIDVPAGSIALSNTPELAHRTLPTGAVRFEFAPTPPLPSYLVAFAVGPFELVDAGRSRAGVPLRVAVRREQDAAAAVKVMAHTLELIEDWTQIPLPYPKLDLVAVPVTGDMWAAMENAGLITMRESVVRADGTAGQSPAALVYVLAHEIAHHWFGDYVTPAWWDDLWLNESFATWLAGKIGTDFVARWRADVPPVRAAPHPHTPLGWADRDGREPGTVRPRPEDVTDTAALRPYFDGDLGVPVIEMLEGLVGADRFRDALRGYLASHAHGTVRMTDLAAAVAPAAGFALDAVLANYLDSGGAQHVDVTVRCTPNAPPVFVLARRGTPEPIPVCIGFETTSGRDGLCHMFDKNLEELPVPGGGCPRWVVPNARRGLYTAELHTFEETFAAWSQLTPDERRSILQAEGTPREDVGAALRLLDASDRFAQAKSAWWLSHYVSFLPDDLRVAFRAKLRAKVGAAARAERIEDPLANTDVLWLAAIGGDPQLARSARTLLASGDELQRNTAIVAWWAALADPVVAGTAIEQLAAGRPRGLTYPLVDALAATPLIVELIDAHPDAFARLDPPLKRRLLTTRCEPSRRAAVERLAQQYFGKDARIITHDFDTCVAARASLEPVFRAWVGP